MRILEWFGSFDDSSKYSSIHHQGTDCGELTRNSDDSIQRPSTIHLNWLDEIDDGFGGWNSYYFGNNHSIKFLKCLPNLILVTSNNSNKPKSLPADTLSSESVTQRLQRLRIENSRREANLCRSQNNLKTSGKIISDGNRDSYRPSNLPLNCFNHLTSTPSKTNLPGPPAPPSWLNLSSHVIEKSQIFDQAILPSSIISVKDIPPFLSHRQEVQSTNLFLGHLEPSPSPSLRFGPLTLSDSCLRCLAFDISKIGSGFHLESVHQLRHDQKSRVLELAAEWCPLDQFSFEALLPSPEQSVNNEDLEGWEEILEEDSSDYIDNLKTLDISFSLVDQTQLSQWLFSPSSTDPFARLLPTQLTTLILNHTQLIISNFLFSLLSHLPLSHLSLADQCLSKEIPLSLALFRLANATPNLRSLNLSFNYTWLGGEINMMEEVTCQKHSLQTVNWEDQWQKLETFVLIKSLANSQSNICKPNIKNNRRKPLHIQLKSLLKKRFANGGKWVEFIID
ncbi:hypothetical protein O181_093710 [Austropuccinia psidii MF-1]|uniref:Uncharacterized protein n=1 Tax=Austropuccinia psidii MF-1 TaxID=1389203 RepID=A0A9Q3J0S1_9BASI|nr:hypothetical protein [Austropuccinia psidii MF-1]